MGKPRRNIVKKQQKDRQKAVRDQNYQNIDAFMKDASNQLHQDLKKDIQTCIALAPVVLEDIKIHTHIEKSKVSKKKEKKKLKRNSLLAKLQSSGNVRMKKREAKERAKAVIVGDMQPLLNALPDLPAMKGETTTEEKHKSILSERRKKKNWNDKKWRTKKKEELQDIDIFKRVLQLPEYKQDPICAIASHVDYMVKGDML